MKTTYLLLAAAALVSLQSTGYAALIAGVDFEDGSSGFSQVPDDLDPTDGITTSSGWTLAASGNIRADTNATAAGAYEGNFPARFEDSGNGTTGFWSISIPNNVILNLDQVFFAVRGATTTNGRDVQFRTSLEGSAEFLYENLNLTDRTEPWNEISLDLTDAKYDGLTDTTIDFIWVSPSGGIDLDGITVSGTIVPEPSAVALLGLGALGLIRRRR